MKKRQLIALTMLVSIIMAAAPASAIFDGQGQIQETPAEELVEIADGAEQQVKNLIDLLYANETALQQIEDFGLIDELESNVTLYGEGVGNLTVANNALEVADYEGAVYYATEALRIFREVFRSIHIILEDARLQKGHLVDAQGLLEAIKRALQRIDRLREVLPTDATNAFELLDQAESYIDIDAARTLLLDGQISEVTSNLNQANQLISQVYQYFKEQAEESNTWRIGNYCERVQERIRERFRAGNQMGISFAAVLESFGYQSEEQFMQTLQNMIQTAQGKAGDFNSALQELEAIGQMVQEMDQALTQEMQRHQGGNGSAGGEGGYGSGYMGSGGSDSGGSGP